MTYTLAVVSVLQFNHCNYQTKAELTLADSCPTATPEHLMAYEFAFFTNQYLCFDISIYSRLSGVMV